MNDKKPWYALRVRTGSERKIKRTLIQDLFKIGVDTIQDEDIIIPFQKVVAIKNNKKELRKRYLGYIFINAHVKKEWVDVLFGISGVFGFVTDSGSSRKDDPAPISPEEIQRMLGKGEDAGSTQDVVVSDVFHENEEVKVVDGALKGFLGVVQKVLPAKGKIMVKVKVFKTHSSIVELSFNQVQKIEKE